MIKLFTISLKTDLTKTQITSGFNELINNHETLWIFPFCLFKKDFYGYLRLKKEKPFTGIAEKERIELSYSYRYGNWTSNQIKISGNIQEDGTKRTVLLNFNYFPIFLIMYILLFVGIIYLTISYFAIVNVLIIGFLITLGFEGYIVYKIYKRIKRKINSSAQHTI